MNIKTVVKTVDTGAVRFTMAASTINRPSTETEEGEAHPDRGFFIDADVSLVASHTVRAWASLE